MSQGPLPSPNAAAVHVHGASGQLGPFTRNQLAQEVAAGTVMPSDHVWYDGLGDWRPLSEVVGLLDGLGESEPPASEDDRLDGVFGALVKASWDYHAEHDFAGHIDEVFLGAIITSTLDTGSQLIDLTSDGSHHYLRFEDPQDHSRVIVRFTHLTPGLATAKVLGQKASVVVGYGERVKDFNKVWQALKAEYKSGLLGGNEPGTISVDGDMGSQYVYCQVSLYLTIDDYVQRSYQVDTARLRDHLDATIHALRKYLRGRFQ